MPETVTTYRASDGTLHETEDAANHHEQAIERRAAAQRYGTWLRSEHPTLKPRAVTRAVNAAEVFLAWLQTIDRA